MLTHASKIYTFLLNISTLIFWAAARGNGALADQLNWLRRQGDVVDDSGDTCREKRAGQDGRKADKACASRWYYQKQEWQNSD